MMASTSPEKTTPEPAPIELIQDFKCFKFAFRNELMPNNILEQLWLQQQTRSLTDLVIHVAERQFPCHRAVLVASSPYFQALFHHQSSHVTAAEITLSHVSAVGFQEVLAYLYGRDARITPDNAIEVLETADFLQFRSLAEACGTFLLQHISPANCLKLQRLGEGHLLRGLAEAGRSVAAQQFSRVCRSQDFIELSISQMKLYLGNPDTLMPLDEHTLRALCEWIRYDIEREGHIAELLQVLPNGFNISSSSLESFFTEYDFLRPYSSMIRSDEIDASPETDGVMPGGTEMAADTLVVIPCDTALKGGEQRRTILYYSNKSGIWKSLTDLPFERRSMFSVTVLSNLLFICGGSDGDVPTSCCSVYDIAGDDWSAITPLQRPRSQHSAVASGGFIYVIGGRTQAASQSLLADGEYYSRVTNQWTSIAAIPDIQCIIQPCLLPYDGKLLVIGGTQMKKEPHPEGDRSKIFHTQVYSLDLNSQVWKKEEQFSSCLEEQNISVGAGDCLEIDGIIVLIDEDMRGKKMRLYNPLEGVMTEFIRSHGQHRFGGYVYNRNTLYCTGGLAYRLSPNDMVHYIDFTGNMGWKMMASLPVPYSHHASVIMHRHGKIHV